MRWIIAFLLALLVSPAAAQYQPCPFVTAGWSKQYSGYSITSVQYDQDQFLLYVIFNNVTATAFSNVPLNVMQGFMSTTNPVSYYSSFVLPSYHALLLAQTNNCPILIENYKFCPLTSEKGVPLTGSGPIPIANEQALCPLSTTPVFLWSD